MYTVKMKHLVGIIFFICAGFFLAVTLKGTILYNADEKQPTQEKQKQPSLLFVGDIMMGRYVETLAKSRGESFMFASTSEFLKSHITIANLEGPIPAIHKPTPSNGFSFSFPSSTPRILKENGIQAVSLANNHMFDYGRSGWEETKEALHKEGMQYFGGYSPSEDDYFETVLGGKKVIVYGITMIATGWDEEQALIVTEKLRRDHPQALLIAYLHWGDEYVTQNRYQRAFAYKLIDRGVDSIVGSHPHVVQGVELYQGKPIFYSLGNFIFDQYWRDKVEDGYILRMSESGGDIIYELIPIHSTRSVPSFAASSTRDRILEEIAQQSDGSLRYMLQKGELRIQK